MPLMQAQEDLDHQLRVEQMQTNIFKMNADGKWETRKFVIQVVVGFAATLGAGAAIGNYFSKNASPVQAQPPQVIYLVPGQAPPAAASPHAP